MNLSGFYFCVSWHWGKSCRSYTKYKLFKLKKRTSHFCCFVLFVQNLRDDQDFIFLRY